MNSLFLYFRYLGISVRSQMQYRVSFLLWSLSNFLGTGIDFLMIWALFHRFGGLKGWTLPQVAFLYGMIHIAFALAEAFARGFDIFNRYVGSGDFDRLLLRPRTLSLQILGGNLQLMRIGRLSQGLIALFWGASALAIHWTAAKILLTLVAVASGAFLFSGLFVLQATMCFWTIESIELVNITTYGGVEAGHFPINIYAPWFRRVFIFVIPLACINYFPAMAIMGLQDPLGSSRLFQWVSPLLGFVFCFLSLQAWRIGVRHYCSTGS